jgi:nitrogen fixation-related uncharacterized protein
MELSWITIPASIAMGAAAALVFVYAVKRGWFKDIEDAKYQVFWGEGPDKGKSTREAADGGQSEKS